MIFFLVVMCIGFIGYLVCDCKKNPTKYGGSTKSKFLEKMYTHK